MSNQEQPHLDLEFTQHYAEKALDWITEQVEEKMRTKKEKQDMIPCASDQNTRPPSLPPPIQGSVIQMPPTSIPKPLMDVINQCEKGDSIEIRFPQIEEEEEVLEVQLLSTNASIPKRATCGSAGYDLSSSHNDIAPAWGSVLISTGLAIRLPYGTYGRIAPRSGLAMKNAITVGAGVIDSDFRGEVQVLLFNHSDKELAIKQGDRIAQLILELITTPFVKVVTSLAPTERGAKGFGSTGVSYAESTFYCYKCNTPTDNIAKGCQSETCISKK